MAEDVTAISNLVAERLRSVGPNRGPDCVYRFTLLGAGGGDFYVTVNQGYGRVERGMPPRSDCRVSLSLTDAVALVRGKLNPVQAFFSGRITVDGDVGAAMRLGQLLRA